jgi:hypothetical protein
MTLSIVRLWVHETGVVEDEAESFEHCLKNLEE